MKNVIIACDFENKQELYTFLSHFPSYKPMLKIGMELFYSEGPDLIIALKSEGYPIFLDLKLHDIPNTVQKAMSNLGKLDVDMINCHAAGGIKMMQAAKKGLNDVHSKALLIAVTQLTSIDETELRQELLIEKPMNETIVHYAKNAKIAGLDGVVCSPLESKIIHESCGENFLAITPGIRLEEEQQHDQKRVTTPALAKTLGSDYIVVGRSITQSKDPLKVYLKMMETFL
ncbi:orotidine-5'-phosphate decarboxylase [Peloplasma aerotolerans]|uniref:Orotidine 5'-phosphate decarboxylase n=1 Tax=Peloplasma aerotolerans TaxID=3044389 RepID=A0AAW6UAY3_9MOLU|nr:orotidine-5'-phosphate decarboxylase [Mariniplasma sp. M4Ah]MDI6452113.1 orotidine-5'-phosphate decarboxylase [Mariniplasma sp. M4Ah]